MTFKTDDRIYETSVTTGTGDYALDGAVTGFQAFSALTANNYCPYFATDGTNWEVGIGQVLSGPARLSRTAVISSSNADAAVNWGSGTKQLRCGLPAWMAVPRVKTKSVAGSSNVTLTQEEQRCDVLILTGALTGSISVIVDATPWRWIVLNSTSGSYTLTVKVSGQTGVVVTQGKSRVLYCDGTDVEDGYTDTGSPELVNNFRLTLTTGTPVTTTDVTGATTVYCTPYKGNRIALYDGSAWNIRTSAEFSLALGTLSSGKPYDVFCYDNSGTPTLEFLAWTNDTTRATALTLQDGVLVKSGATTRRYLGTFYTTATTTTEDSAANRYLWNYYNRVQKAGDAAFTADRTTSSASSVEINSEIRNNFVIGVAEDVMTHMVSGGWTNSGAGSVAQAGVAYDGTTIESGASLMYLVAAANNGARLGLNATGIKYPGIGKHYATVCGLTAGSLTLTFYGTTSVNTTPVRLSTLLPR